MLLAILNLCYFLNVPSQRIFNGAVLREKSGEKVEGFLPKNRKLKFFYMGRIEETKGVKLLLDTFQDFTDVELYLAGKVYDSEIQKNIDENVYSDNIKFLGFIKPETVLPEIDILIAPSLWHEPLPRVILEAYSFNKPVIGSTRGGIPECIKDKETGLLFDPANPEQLRNIIKELINNQDIINFMVSNIPQYLRQFDIDTSVNQYIGVYKSLI
jgi:glycosyltransferase involved in cell wall biosynthesis